ncbi:MAG: threonylcarbamoyl-AMP synthase [Deltaproteobacteria bacterium]|nr:threonylcarbamoyl-AMP synthase [Deltaproteobacteria bacterium]
MNQRDTYLAILRHGGVIACPTETLFGLLADALNPRAVARVFAIKRRRAQDPIAVLVSSIEMASTLVTAFSDLAFSLAERHWPGPLTLVMRAREGLPSQLLRDGKIGLRIPGPCPAFDLVKAFGGPLTATSANLASRPSAWTDRQVSETIGPELDAVVPGRAPGGAPSTVVDVTQTTIRIIRQGAIEI